MLVYWSALPLWLQIVSAVFLSAWLVQFLYLLIVRYAPMFRTVRVKACEEKQGVSVIVYAHNQSEDLARSLPKLLENDYPEFEVIVVNDASVDDTLNVLTQMEQRSDRLFHTNIDTDVRLVSHTKLAMMLGVKAAHHDIILMTQAQCIPASNRWVASMARQFDGKADIVLGPVVYENRIGVFNRFYQWDLFDRVIDMLGLTLSVQAYGGFAYNMAFRKEAFFADNSQSFIRHLNIHPGEDDLFVAESARVRTVSAEVSADAVVSNEQTPVRFSWQEDRWNRAFTSQYYLGGACFARVVDVLTRYLTVLPGWALIAYGVNLQDWVLAGVVGGMLFVRYLMVALAAYTLSRKLRTHRFFTAPLFYELISPLIDVWYRIKVWIYSDHFYVANV